MQDLAARFHRLEELTRRVARAAAELRAASEAGADLEAGLRAELEALADQAQALQMLLANETERAWNRAEAAARQARRSRALGQIHDAATPEAPYRDR